MKFLRIIYFGVPYLIVTIIGAALSLALDHGGTAEVCLRKYALYLIKEIGR